MPRMVGAIHDVLGVDRWMYADLENTILGKVFQNIMQNAEIVLQ